MRRARAGEGRPAGADLGRIGAVDAGALFALALATLREKIGGLIDGRPVAALDWPAYPNAGDHFIWLGQKALLRSLGARIVHETSARAVDFQALAALPKETVLLFQGGGNFGDLYRTHQALREAAIAAFPDHRIVLMPQSVCYRSGEAAANARRLYRAHGDLHILARDRASLDFIRAHVVRRRTALGLDSALYLAPIVQALARALPPSTRRTLSLMRFDQEAADYRGRARLMRGAKDWSIRDDLRNASETESAGAPFFGGSARRPFSGDLDRASWRRLYAAVTLFSTAEEIVTDRLHGHLLCLMMGKPHRLYDANNGKIRAFRETWEDGAGLA